MKWVLSSICSAMKACDFLGSLFHVTRTSILAPSPYSTKGTDSYSLLGLTAIQSGKLLAKGTDLDSEITYKTNILTYYSKLNL